MARLVQLEMLSMKLYVGLIQFLFVFQAQATDLNKLLSDKLYLHVKVEPSQKIIETEPLKQLYELNGYAALWTAAGQPNQAALVFKQILLQADDWGLTTDQYLPKELLNLFDRVNEKNAVTFEILLSDAYLNFSRDLINGQILDPDLIDEDIKMPRKNFQISTLLVEAAKRPETLVSVFEKMSPQHEKYKKLIFILKKMKTLKAQKAWSELLVDPMIDLKVGAQHEVLVEVKKRMTDLGYPISNQSNVYDAELQKAVTRYQELNSLQITRTLSRSFFKSIGPGLQDRIDKIKANLEKYRWFPQVWENRYLIVNMAFQEMNVVENNQTIMAMKTVNGRPTRRTPTMRDEIRRVELSPTWTVPYSIAVKDKLPDLQENPYVWQKSGIKIYNRSNQEVDPGSINWRSYDRTNFDFTLVQQPGPQNALGLVKFPLTNPWFIYLHDTNEIHLMKESARLRSSGCVRLEDAFKLAQYLLRDQLQWNLKEMKIQRSQPLPIPVKQSLPVYFMYQTVDVTASGEIRTAIDHYGQDQRLIELFRSRGSREKF